MKNMTKLRRLVLSFANPRTWRSRNDTASKQWQQLRQKILERDGFACQYCGYKSNKFQIVHHIDGNPKNSNENNLTTTCQMCNLIEHSGQGCVLKGIVDLYKISKYNQTEIIKITRDMRDRGKDDQEIIRFLGLKEKAHFKMDKKWLSGLFGFITSRPSRQEDDMYDKWLSYHRSRLVINESQQKTLPTIYQFKSQCL
jgi:hypothetical protein